MMNYEENPIVKGVLFARRQSEDGQACLHHLSALAKENIRKGILFMSSMKSQENVEQMVMQIKVQCAKRNILVGDVAVEHNQIGDMDLDRPAVKAVANAVAYGDYEVLVLRNQYDVTEDDSDWEKFVGDMADMDVRVYLADVGEFAGNAYEE